MSAPGALAVLRSLMTDAAITRMYDHDAEAKHAAAENALAAVAELVEAAHRAEVSFNTVGGCYERNPGNFMVAMRELEQDVLPLRAALARVGGGK